MTEEKGAQSASAGGVYVSRPGGDSGFAPSLVTTTSPDHPSNRVATENAASASFRMPSDQMREQYEKISRDVIGRLIGDPVIRADAFENLGRLLSLLDLGMVGEATDNGAENEASGAAGAEPSEEAQSPSAPNAAREKKTAK